MSRKRRYRSRFFLKLIASTLGIALIIAAYGYLGQADRDFTEAAKAEYYASR